MRAPVCDRCGVPEAIVQLSLNRGGPRGIEWCQRCLDEFRLWARIPPPPVVEPPLKPIGAAPKRKAAKVASKVKR